MNSRSPRISLLVAEDDPDDRLLMEEAFREVAASGEMIFVANGQALLDYLHREGEFSKRPPGPLPGLILLDLNMPRRDGREVLHDLKQDSRTRRIPVVVLTTSTAEDDVHRSYDLGGNSYITKPVDFSQLVKMMKSLVQYWFHTVKLPHND